MKNCKNCRYFKVVYRQYGFKFTYSLTYARHYCCQGLRLLDNFEVCENRKSKKTERGDILCAIKTAEKDLKYIIGVFEIT